MSDVKKSANERFEQAVAIVRDGRIAANAYAEQAAKRYQNLNPFQTPPGGWTAWKAHVAKNAAACAKKIVADGRAHYETEIDGQQWLVICTLAADASAGPVGYELWNRA